MGNRENLMAHHSESTAETVLEMAKDYDNE